MEEYNSESPSDNSDQSELAEVLRQTEEQLRQSQKLEAIGRLAGGIAHDFNNLLTVVSGYSDLTLRSMSNDDPLRHHIEEIKNAGERASALTTQLLAFSRRQVLKPQVHSLNSIISNVENMLRRLIRESIELRTDLDPNLGNIKADPGQIEQVILNLVVNARDAMPNGGKLTIETRNVFLRSNYGGQDLIVVPGPFVKMSVIDTGGGIDEEVRDRIFEPFFTTKEIGKGTGLGLSTVHGIVRQSGGDIRVSSELGQGTTFQVFLPCVDEPIKTPKWNVAADEDLSGAETILLVEDDESVRNMVREILSGNGYKVLEADNVQTALSICGDCEEVIHMLLTDIVMPKMSGFELKGHVSKQIPDIKVLFMSGYSDESFPESSMEDSTSGFIEKPFRPDELLSLVKKLLDDELTNLPALTLKSENPTGSVVSDKKDFLSTIKVLVVDDEPSVLDLLKKILEDLGCVVEIALLASDAISIAGKFKADVIISDYRMPELDGIQTLTVLRDLLPMAIPILITAEPDDIVIASVFQDFPFDVVRKPISPIELQQALARAIELRDAIEGRKIFFR